MITNGINQKVFGSAPILKTKKHSGAILMDGTNDLLSHSSLSVGRAESNMHIFFFLLNITVTRKLSEVISSPVKSMNKTGNCFLP